MTSSITLYPLPSCRSCEYATIRDSLVTPRGELCVPASDVEFVLDAYTLGREAKWMAGQVWFFHGQSVLFSVLFFRHSLTMWPGLELTGLLMEVLNVQLQAHAAPATTASNFTVTGRAQGWAHMGSTAVPLFKHFLIQANSNDGPEVEGHLLCWQNKINLT